MKTLSLLPSNPTYETFTNLADLYYNNKLTPADIATIKAKYHIGTILTIDDVDFWLSDYEQGKSEALDPKDVPLFIFTTVNVYQGCSFIQFCDNILI